MSEAFLYLNEEQKRELDGLPFSVLLPSELPAEWTLENLSFQEEEEGASFQLQITKGAGRLAFLTTNEGIGDPPGGHRTSKHAHPELGEVVVEFEEDGDFLSDWIEIENAWSAVSGNSVDDEALGKVIASLVAY